MEQITGGCDRDSNIESYCIQLGRTVPSCRKYVQPQGKIQINKIKITFVYSLDILYASHLSPLA